MKIVASSMLILAIGAILTAAMAQQHDTRSQLEISNAPVALLPCQVTTAQGGVLVLGFVTDTRALSVEKAAQYVARAKALLESRGYQCDHEEVATDHQIQEDIDRLVQRQQIVSTYLRYVDSEGLVGAITFANAGPKLGNLICDEFLKQMRPTVRDAECIPARGP
jgi:hypothetical protein